MSRCKHPHLSYKMYGSGDVAYLACPDCGMVGTIKGTEAEAKEAIRRHLAKHAPTLGFNRRARKARAARR